MLGKTSSTPDVAAEVDSLMAVEPRVHFPETPRVAQITNGDVWLIRGLIAGGVAAVAAFLWFLWGLAEPGVAWLYWPLVAAFTFAALLSLYEWYCYLGVTPCRERPKTQTEPTVDVLTTWCPGEPKVMVVATLKSILRMPYQHTTYLCDEGDDPALREVCARLGIRHVTRTDKTGAKAGNINNALRGATGKIAVIMDPDHEAAPYFLDRVVGHFDDSKVGFVQHVQAYYNQDESLIARGAAEQTYHFYGPIQTGMERRGTVQAIGANCAFRKAALESIGGHATGLAEDMATTLKIYAKGWTSVYSPEILTCGQVPSTFPAYCKQQLKWACGVWDILIESYPAAFPHISWRNRLHFAMNGLFYFRSLFVLIGTLIPIVALFTGLVPVRITVEEFLIWFGPMLSAVILIRQAAQRWLLDPNERGLHLIGGFLMNAVWLIHLRGVASAILRVKIPYIPTPKDDEATNAWSLAMPGILLVVLSTAAIVYGLWWDWSPYSGLMAGFALVNIVTFGTIALAAQQRLLAGLRSGRGPVGRLLAGIGRVGHACADALCWTFRRGAGVLAVIIASVIGYTTWSNPEETPLEELWAQMEGMTEKDSGGFMLGTYFPVMERAAYGKVSKAEAMTRVDSLESALGQDMSVVSVFYEWNEVWDVQPFVATLNGIRDRGKIPMVTWMPTLSGFTEARNEPRYYNEHRVFELVLEGRFDAFIDQYARLFRDHGDPVLLRFAHEMDNPQYPWSKAGGNTPKEFIEAWRYVVNRFRAQGASNVSWVWSPWNVSTLRDYYPGNNYVDLIGLTVLNYGSTQGFGQWYDFDALYEPLSRALRDYPAPILIAEFGSTGLGGDRTAWLNQALDSIASRPEIAGAVLFNSDEDANWPQDWADARDQFLIKWSMEDKAAELAGAFDRLMEARPPMPLQPPHTPTHSPSDKLRVARTDDRWHLKIDGEPFEIRGVAYDVGEGWRGGEVATRRVIEEDFRSIAKMGANTVRRYSTGWPDTNVLRAAKANGLKVMMGLWLDPSVDYANDSAKLAALEDELVDAVKRWKDHPAILAWSVGNETWGYLKHSYVGPELTRQRRAYLSFVERLAAQIKEIDQVRPVLTSLEYSSSAPGAVVDVLRYVPSVDAVGVNAYYRSHLEQLKSTLLEFEPEIPVFLSEFGPRGYWDPDGTLWSNDGFPIEPSDTEKVHQYYVAWEEYAAKKPFGLGGVAFTWQDRLEGSPTWFGLSDHEGRKKPSYYMLQRAWTDTVLPVTGLPTEFAIEMPERATPGETVDVMLKGKDWAPGCSLSWWIVNEMTFETVWEDTVASCDGDRAYPIEVPGENGRYRLLAHVWRGDSVTTASHPLFIGDRHLSRISTEGVTPKHPLR